MNKNLKFVLIAAATASFVASAHNPVNALIDSSGAAVKNGFDQCVEVVDNAPHADCGAATPRVVEEQITIGAHALFDTAKSNLRPAGKAELDALAAAVAGSGVGRIDTVQSIKVVGHTDSRGSNSYNQGLSERRAASVRNYLVQKGVPANMITAYGEGEMNPVDTNKTAAGRQQNRRVNISVTGTEKVEKN